MRSPTSNPAARRIFCPWNQTLPFVLRAAPRLEEHAARMLVAHAALPDGRAKR